MLLMGHSLLPAFQYQMYQRIGCQIPNTFGRGRKLIQKIKRTQLYLLHHKLSRTPSGKQASLQPSAQAAGPEFTGTPSADEFVGTSAGATQVESGGSRSSKRDVANIGLGEDDGQGDDVLTYERPGMDIFKAIFASDDEESNEEKDCMDDVDEVDEAPAVSMPAGPSKPGPNVKPPPANGIVEDVDLATFKPTFMPRGSKLKDVEKKEKKNKKQKSSKGGTLVSFDVDEDGGESLLLTAAHRKHRDRDSERPRKRKRKDREGDGGEDMWVEKPPPDIVKALPITEVSPDEGGQVNGQESGPPRACKRAIDCSIAIGLVGWEGMHPGRCRDACTRRL